MSLKLSHLPYHLESDHLSLRCLTQEDARALLEAIDESRADLERWLPRLVSLRTFNDAAMFARKSRGLFDLMHDFTYGVFDPRDGRLLGSLMAHAPEAITGRATIEYWVRSSATNRGVAREALTTLLRALFDAGAHRVDMMIEPNNRWSRALAERLGFRKEGVHYEFLVEGERRRDVMSYALLSSWRDERTLSTKPSSSISGERRLGSLDAITANDEAPSVRQLRSA